MTIFSDSAAARESSSANFRASARVKDTGFICQAPKVEWINVATAPKPKTKKKMC